MRFLLAACLSSVVLVGAELMPVVTHYGGFDCVETQRVETRYYSPGVCRPLHVGSTDSEKFICTNGRPQRLTYTGSATCTGTPTVANITSSCFERSLKGECEERPSILDNARGIVGGQYVLYSSDRCNTSPDTYQLNSHCEGGRKMHCNGSTIVHTYYVDHTKCETPFYANVVRQFLGRYCVRAYPLRNRWADAFEAKCMDSSPAAAAAPLGILASVALALTASSLRWLS